MSNTLKPENVIALKKCVELADTVQNYYKQGNFESAHRATAMYHSLMLTVLVTELVPGAGDLLNKFEEEAGATPFDPNDPVQ